MEQKLRKPVAWLLTLAMIFTMLSSFTFTALAADNLCEHHAEHTAECGYVEGVSDCAYHCDVCLGHDHGDEVTEEDTESAPVCDCGTDDPAIHAVSCAVYVAPENPQCFCAEKCTEANVWCDICGFDYTQCTGTDTAAAYADGDDLTISGAWMSSSTPYLASGSTTASATQPETGGYAHWDAASNTLTLNNFTSAIDAATGILYQGQAETLCIELVGNNSVTGGNVPVGGPRSGVSVSTLGTNVIFSGDGTLTATGTGTGNSSGNGVFARGDITVDSGTTLIATSGSSLDGVEAERGSIIVNAGGSLTGNGGESGGNGVRADTGITVNGGSLTGNSKVSSGVYADSITVSGNSHIVANGGNGNRIPVGNLPEDYYYYASGDGTDKTFTHSTDAPLTGTVTETYFELVTAQHLSDTYTSNGDATHSRYCSCALHTKVTAPEACSGGTATCTEQAECQHCGVSYGDVADHSMGYVADEEANTITYRCGTCDTKTVTFTLVIPTGVVYGDSPLAVPNFDRSDETYSGETPVITLDGNTLANFVPAAKTYTVTMTWGGKTVSGEYTIAKAEVSITATPTPNTLTYTGEAHNLISQGEADLGTMVYSLTEDGEYTTTIPKGTNAGDYTVWYYVQGDANHNDSAKDSVDVTIAKAEPRAEDFIFQAPGDLTYNGETKSASVSVQDGIVGMGDIIAVMYYNGDSNIAVEKQPISAGDYFVQINVGEGENYTAKSFFGGEDWVFTIAPMQIYIEPVFGATLADVVYNESGVYTLTVTGVTFKSVGAGNTVPLTLGTDYTATATQTDVSYGELIKAVTAAVDVTLTNGNYRLVGTAAIGATANIVEHQHAWTYTAKDDTITATCNAEGCPDAEQSITISAVGKTYDGTPVTATLTGSIDGVATPEITYTGNTNAGTHTASITIDGKTASAEFTISKAKQVAPNLSKTDETLKGQENGTITGVTNKMEYATTSGGSYTAITGTTLDNLAAGTYHVRLAADANHNASPDTAVTIAAGKAITVTYDQGTQAASGMPAQLTDLSYGTKLTKPTDPTASNTDFAFVGWFKDSGCTDEWNFNADTLTSENVTLYAKWKQVYFSVTAAIKDHEGNEYHGTVEVDLMRGNNLIDSVTGTSGSFQFSKHVEAGMYNLVAIYTDNAGKHTKTELITVDDDGSYILQLPAPGVNSHLDVSSNAETPAVMVGGLDAEAADVKEDADNAASGGETVKEVSVTMDVEGKKETQVNDDVVQKIKEAIAEAPGSEVSTVVEYLDIKVNKEVVTDSGTTTTPITETANVIEIVIPFNFSGRTGIKIIRHHDDAATALREADTKVDGTFYLDNENGYIHIFTKLFSTYAVSYTTSYNVTFDVNGGDGSNSNASTNTDGTVVLPADPTRSGYTFKGWYTAASGGTKVTGDYVFSGDTTVYAQWTQNYSGGGGGYVPSTYSITVEDATNGTVKVDRTRTSSGTTVTLTVTPDTGYTLETLTVTTNSGKEVELTNKGNGQYTFKMPSSKVTIKATFMDDNTMLNFFVDVPADAYYYDAVLWAAKSGITSGTTATTFSPNNPCTRAQMATFLWRTAGSPEPMGKSNPFTDVRVDAYYAKAVQWAYEQGITGGTSATTFSPDDTCTRGQMATFLWRNAGSKAPVNNVNQFADVPADKYYAVAVQWAYEQKITSGTSATTFSPDDPCTRAQMATFLYRYFVK